MASACRPLWLGKNWTFRARQQCRCLCTKRNLTNSDVRQKRSALFEEEKKRQFSLVTRIEKIEVQYKGTPEDTTLVMNKGLSTPFNCAMHIQELLTSRTALALVDGEPWDMHRPLNKSCQLQFLHFQDEDPTIANNAFWRTCSFTLGYVLENAFKDQYYIELCSFPKPNVKSGSFIYDADLKFDNWKPSKTELNCLSRIGAKLYHSDLQFERLDIDASLAAKIFEDNRFKSAQIPAIAAKSESGSKVTVYRMGDHVDITAGPLISSTSLIGRFTVTAIHDIESPTLGPLKRVQGVALPTQLKMHYWTYDNILVSRGAKLNHAPFPFLSSRESKTKQVAYLEN
ncbi:39S ribosomal protein L39, mitochondrial-like [Pomacea canaliculata]|uniref:39S ribosomal protein L39, mitochondrial-like n=1 Tax=Pomacea canaliculata TaxID=400727 RepID=UPI000D72C776|nr:39S ribosomal protein L39, mitochondrial-like [Pomacea canaliculata]